MWRNVAWLWVAGMFAGVGRLAGGAEDVAPRPVAALVVSGEAPIHSGPGGDYYQTTRVKRNTVVEVYRQERGGWLAVRPPDESYSWVESRYLQPVPGGERDVLQVTHQGVPVFVGSSVTGDRDVISLKLRRGEQVVTLPSGRGSDRRWTKIAPPAGEFRYILARHVQTVTAKTEAPDFVPPTEAASTGPVLSNAPDTTATATPARPATPATTTLVAPRPRSAVQPGPVDTAEDAHSGPSPPTGAATDRANPAALWASDGSFPAELQRVEYQLTAMLADDSGAWRLDQLAREVEGLSPSAQTPQQRGQVRALQNKIAKLAALQNQVASGTAMAWSPRGVATPSAMPPGPASPLLATTPAQPLAASPPPANPPPANPPPANPPPANPPPANPPPANPVTTIVVPPTQPRPTAVAAPAPAVDPRYDGAGWLREVISEDVNTPKFALVDASNRIVTYVSPAPGVNLRAHLANEVGITGIRGFMAESGKPHLTAQRITLLDATARR